MGKGRIVAGVLAPHSPHLIFVEKSPQKQPTAECGWEGLRCGYEHLAVLDCDVHVILPPHWQT